MNVKFINVKWCTLNCININVKKTKYCNYGQRAKLNTDRDTPLAFGEQNKLRCHQYNFLGVHLDECLNLCSNVNSILTKIFL